MMFNPYFGISAFAFLLMTAVFFFIKEKLFSISSIVYGLLIGTVLINLALDITGAYTISYSNIVPLWVNIVVNLLFYIFQILAAVMFMVFAIGITGNISFKSKKTYLPFAFSALPAIAAIILIFMNVNEGYFFWFDENLRYMRGEYRYVLYIVAAFYMLLGAYFVVRYRKRITDVQFCTIISYVGVMALAVSAQHMFPRYLLSGSAAAIALVSMYFTFKNPDDYVDKLTGFFDRTAFSIVAEQEIKRRKQNNDILLVDICDFKTVNNMFGIKSGDKLLIEVARYLSGMGAKKRSLFRLGGDKFALIVASKDAGRIVEQIIKRFSYAWPVEDARIMTDVLVCRIVADVLKKGTPDIMSLIENALILSKQDKRGSSVNIDAEAVKRINRRLKIESRLRNSLFEESLSLYFQPIYDVKKARITSAEALLRMDDEELGRVSPDELINIAEQKGIIRKIGQFTAQKVSEYIHINRLWEFGVDKVGVNLSLAEFLHEDLAESLRKIITMYPEDKTKINFEITETTAPESVTRIRNTMEELIEYGATFSLDDYGKGYSNSSMIIKLPFESVKLDKEMLWNMDKNNKAFIAYKNLSKMCLQMGLKLVCEGAETKEQVQFLNEIQADYIQGYYFGRPVPADAFLNSLRREYAAEISEI